MGKRMLRKVSGSTWPAESLRHHKSRGPQHHKERRCKGNPVGRGFHGLSHAKLCGPRASVILRTFAHIGYA